MEIIYIRELKNLSPNLLRRRREIEGLNRNRVAYLEKDYVQGFIQHCAIQVVSVERGRFVSTVKVGPEHRQQDDFIHAGLIATMADHTAGYAAFTLVPEEYRILTIEFKINFLRPAYGERLICRSRIIKEGAQVMVGESEVYDLRQGEETLVAKAMVTLAPVHQERLKDQKGRP